MTSASGADARPVIPILMPEAGNTMETGTILSWNVMEGDRVTVGDVLCEIETDKAAMEYESPATGRLAKIVASEGDTVPVKQPIAYLAESDIVVETLLTSTKPPSPPKQATAITTQSVLEQPSTTISTPTGTNPTYPSSPAVRRLARQLGIDVRSLGKGSGPRGRILTTDLERWKISSSAATSEQITTGELPDAQRHPIGKMRRRIGQRLTASKQSIPHFYVKTNVLADELYHIAREENDITINDLVVLSCGRTLAKFSAFRSRLEGNEIIEEAGAHIGIAVGVDEGLVVPVIRDVQALSLVELASKSKNAIDDARRGIVANVGSGVFSVSNLGMFGVEEFTAIVNPPESGILAIGAVREQVIVEEGVMRPGRVMTLILSADHRLIDGIIAAHFLAELKRFLESPGQLMVD